MAPSTSRADGVSEGIHYELKERYLLLHLKQSKLVGSKSTADVKLT